MAANLEKPSFDFSRVELQLPELEGDKFALCLHNDTDRAKIRLALHVGRNEWDIYRMSASYKYYDIAILKTPLFYGREILHAIALRKDGKTYIVK